jgi:hypothetical protein
VSAIKFRKRPVVIEAMQLIDDLANHTAIADWVTSHGGKVRMPALEPCLYIQTLEGEMRADLGDWVIRGLAGEFYPCKPDVFEKSYEAVEPVEATNHA